MWASRPAAGLPFSFFQFFNHTDNMLYPRFAFFDDGNPANPFVALNRRKIIPFHKNVRFGCQCFLHITRHFMQDAIGNFTCHFFVF